MPSFKRREPALERKKLADGLRPSPYPSLVPHFSTGLASLDDVLSGSGLPSSSILAICPALGLASLTLQSEVNEEPGKKSLQASGSNQTLDSLKAAEDACLDLLSYSIAQSLTACQETLVIGHDARTLLESRLPGKATTRDYGQSAEQQEEDAMTIAFRYAHRPKFKTTVDEPEVAVETKDGIPEEHLFRAPFDLTKRWKSEELTAAEGRERGRLRCIDAETYEAAWSAIEEEADRCKQLSLQKAKAPPALRIHLPELGWQGSDRSNVAALQARLTQLSRFLGRLRRLLKAFSLCDQAPMHCICILTVSPDLLLPKACIDMATLHLSRFVDAQLLVSDFSRYPHLRKAYLGYGGAVSLLKGPSVGFLLPPGESRSVLRGGVAEAGAENDVGWKRKRRGVVLETLHEDVDAGVKDDDKRQTKDSSSKKHGDDIEEVAHGLSRKLPPQVLPHAHPHTEPAPRPTRIKFEGLKSLRERGLRATKQVNVQVEKTEDW